MGRMPGDLDDNPITPVGYSWGGEVRLGATHPALGPRQGCQRWAQSRTVDRPGRQDFMRGRLFVSRVYHWMAHPI